MSPLATTGIATARLTAANPAAISVSAASQAPGTERTSGVSCLWIPLDADGVTVAHTLGMGCLPLGWGSIHFDDVFVPTANLVGEEGRGFAGAMHHFDFSRAALGSEGVASTARMLIPSGHVTDRGAYALELIARDERLQRAIGGEPP